MEETNKGHLEQDNCLLIEIHKFAFMNNTEIKSFVDMWLMAWTGNNPYHLLTFYTEDVFYLDPANIGGIKGKEQLAGYFEKLLSRNPDWYWTSEEIFPTQKGFTIKWKAEIPLPSKILTIYGLDIVELNAGKISRNEVYFDRSEWQKELIKG